jgi:hypothetical protein
VEEILENKFSMAIGVFMGFEEDGLIISGWICGWG